MAKRKDTMTNRERVEALLRHEKPDRVPIWPFALGFTAVYTGISISDGYSQPGPSLIAQRKTCRDFDWISTPFIASAIMGAWEFGGEIKWPSGEFAQAPSVTRHVVETTEEVMKLGMPDVKNSGFIPRIVEFGKLALDGREDNEPFRLLLQMEGTFNTAANIPGAAKLTKWLIKKPEAAHRVLRLATDYLVELARYYKDTFGTEGVALFGGDPSSSNQVISPKHFETFALPYLKETHEKVLAMGFKTLLMHICGEQNLNLPYWAQMPMGDPGLVSFGHEVNLEEGARYFPNDIIVGNLEPAIIQTGTPDEVYAASRKVVEKGKNLATGFIFAPGCELPPRAPAENLKAMTQAVFDHGWYD